MKPQELQSLDKRLSRFLEDLLIPMGRSERRHWARVYVQGLLLDGERKSIEPIASRIGGAEVQALRQFVGQSPWAVEEIQRRLAQKAVDLFSQPEVWLIDDTSFPKAGSHSVGVARQYCGALGKVANCQVAVTLHWGNGEMSCPLGWRLYLPQQWLADAERGAKVKLPTGTVYKTKGELALELIDQSLHWELPQLPVVADSFYGNDFSFREALRSRGLHYVMAVEPTTVVWSTEPNMAVPRAAGKGRPRRYPPEDRLPETQDLLKLARSLPTSAWRAVCWRQGRRDNPCSRFALTKVWAAHGWRKQHHCKRRAEWLLVEWPLEEEKPTKYWLADLGAKRPGLPRVAKIAHSRWRIELDYRELKEELGLDHFEGRHWLGWHHHVTLVSMAYAFLRSEQARIKKNFWLEPSSGSPENAVRTDTP